MCRQAELEGRESDVIGARSRRSTEARPGPGFPRPATRRSAAATEGKSRWMVRHRSTKDVSATGPRRFQPGRDSGEEARIFMRLITRLAGLVLLAAAMLPSIGRAEVPVFTIARGDSSIKFHVNASIALDGTFDKWTGTLTFSSADVTTGVLDLEVEAASVDTGSGLKDSTLKSDDFFAVDQNPTISFRSTKVMQTSTDTFAVQGNFTIRGVSRPETLTLAVSGK